MYIPINVGLMPTPHQISLACNARNIHVLCKRWFTNNHCDTISTPMESDDIWLTSMIH